MIGGIFKILYTLKVSSFWKRLKKALFGYTDTGTFCPISPVLIKIFLSNFFILFLSLPSLIWCKIWLYLPGKKKWLPVPNLGVTISNDLKWNRHISNICSKANKTLGFLRRNLRISNPKVKRMAYQAMVRPILEYSSPVWDPFTADLVDTLEKVQRRATRWICNRYRQTSSVDDMLIDLEMPTLASRRKDARLVTFFKFHNKLTNINSKFAPSQSIRRRSLRRFNAQSYNVPSNRTEYRQKSFFPRTIPEWNALPDATVQASTVDAFKQRLHN